MWVNLRVDGYVDVQAVMTAMESQLNTTASKGIRAANQYTFFLEGNFSKEEVGRVLEPWKDEIGIFTVVSG